MNRDPHDFFVFPSLPRTSRPAVYRNIAWKCRVEEDCLHVELVREEPLFRLDRSGRFVATVKLSYPCGEPVRWFGDELAIPLRSSDGVGAALRVIAQDGRLILEGPWVTLDIPAAAGGFTPLVTQRIDTNTLNVLFDGWELLMNSPSGIVTEIIDSGVRVRGGGNDRSIVVLEHALRRNGVSASDDREWAAVLAESRRTANPTRLPFQAGATSLTAYPAAPWFGEDDAALWEHLWTLHKIATYEPSGFHSRPWQDPGRGYFRTLYGHWDTLHSALEWLLVDPQRSIEMMLDYFTLWDEATGMVGMRWRPDQKSHDRPWTTPPLWASVSWSIYRRTRDRGFLSVAYDRCLRNFDWWEKHRRFQELPLYYYANIGESGYDNMPRGDWDHNVSRMPDGLGYAPVDLNCQLAEYCDVLARMSEELGASERRREFEHRSRLIANAVRTYLWDEETSFFYDLHVPTGSLQRVKTIAAFWALTCGVADPDQARKLISHLTNPAEFWTAHPVPSVALDEEAFQLDMWRGPVWNSQNLWICRGLRRCGERGLAKTLAQRSWKATLEVFRRTGKVFEFYNPLGFDLSQLTRKGDPGGPCAYYIGHNPLHVLVQENLI